MHAIGADNAVWVNKGSGWVSLGGYVKAISATVENTVYAIGVNDDVFVGHGTPGLGWVDTGLKARQISAGADAIGNPEVYVIGFDNAVYDIDTVTGAVKSIPVGQEPHGLTVWPQPGRYSLGHTGNMR